MSTGNFALVEKNPSTLTEKQEAFCREYLVDLNGTQAAIRAGYAESGANVEGSRLLTNANVQQRVAELKEERNKRVEISQDYVLSVIKETIERCRQVYPVLNRKGEQVLVEGRDGKIVPAFTFNAKAVLQGTEQLGKHLKMFTDKSEIQSLGADGQPSDGFTITVNHVKPDAKTD